MRAAVVGTAFGARIHVPALRAAGFEVVALVGSDPEKTRRRAERLGVETAAPSLEDALRLGLDAVSIATPPATHAGLARQALEAGAHVLCEKPFTLNAPEALELSASARTRGLVALLGHEFRWAEDQAVAARVLRSGRIGVPRIADLVSASSFLWDLQMNAWWFDPAAGGGWLGASGSHLVDQLHTWFGPIARVSASLIQLGGFGVDDGFQIRYETASGVEGTLAQNCAAWGPGTSYCRVLGRDGTLWLDSDGVMVADKENPGGVAVAVPDDVKLPAVEAQGPFAALTRMELPAYTRLAEAFMSLIRTGSYTGDPAPATFADGALCMRVLDAIRLSSSERKRWVEVDGAA